MRDEVKTVKHCVPVELSTLHNQYIPYITPIDLWNNDMSLAMSPHVEMLQYIVKHGFNWKEIFKLRYAQERMRRAEIGWPKWDKATIKRRIMVRWKIYKSLAAHGYKQSMAVTPIMILEKPFWTTRFGLKDDRIRGPEIFDGAGRCSAAYVLGWDAILADICIDPKAGTGDRGRFASKLKPMEKHVWP
jgi:hypothetical protein